MHAADFMNNIKLQMTFFCNILQHYQLLFVDFTWMSKVQVIQLFILARKPSPAASQYFRTWSQKFSEQISGDCTPALGLSSSTSGVYGSKCCYAACRFIKQVSTRSICVV